MSLNGLQKSDQEAAAVQKTPNRVTLEKLEQKVESVEYINPKSAPHVTLAFVTMKNGFCIVGKAAPADPENYNQEYGCTAAYADAIRQAWGFEGYLLCEELWQDGPEQKAA